MEHALVDTPAQTLIGLTARVLPAHAMDTIGGLWGRIMAKGALDGIPGRVDAHTLVAAYCDYETDETGPYTLLVGTPVAPETVAPTGWTRRTFEPQRAAVISVRGRIPAVVQETWTRIHRSELPRAFTVDYERYDLRSSGPDAAIDFYIAVR